MRNVSRVLIVSAIALIILAGTLRSSYSQTGQFLSVTPDQGPVGTIVEAKAEGFRSFVVNFSFAGKYIGWTLQTSNTSGAIREFRVPDVPPGIYTIKAIDNFGGYAETTFAVTVRVSKDFDTAWQQEYGDFRTESTSNLVEVSDGGFVFLDRGWTHGFTLSAATLYKVNASGAIEWKKSLDYFWKGTLVQTSDGGYAILGEWSTYGTTYQHVPTLIKTDFNGNIQWVRNYSSSLGDQLLLTRDGGFAMLRGNPNLDFPPRNHVGDNIVATITKTDSQGVILWSKNFSEPGLYNTLNQMIQTTDNGYIMVGTTSFNGTNDTPNLYFWLLKTDSQGNIQWKRLYGEGPMHVVANQTENAGALDGINRRTTGDNQGISVTQTSDGGFVVSGIVYPARNYSWWGFSYSSTPNLANTLLVKTDPNGNTVWNQTYDGYAFSNIIQTSDGGLAFAGSLGIVKTDGNGSLQWIKDDVTFPSLGIRPYLLQTSSIVETSDGALAGIGVGTRSQSWQGNIYLFKTQPFLPLPTPSPTQTPTENFPTSWSLAVLVLLIGMLTATILIYKRLNHTSKNLQR